MEQKRNAQIFVERVNDSFSHLIGALLSNKYVNLVHSPTPEPLLIIDPKVGCPRSVGTAEYTIEFLRIVINGECYSVVPVTDRFSFSIPFVLVKNSLEYEL